MDYKGKQISGRDIATVELLEEIKAYFSEDGAALNALALGGVNATSYALKADVDKSIADLVGSAPEALDTLYEISAVLQENVADIDTILTQIGTKANQTALDEAVGRIEELENAPDLDYKGVTDALGFTPLDADNFTKANIKSKLGISDWALASSKPSYAFSELTSRPSTLVGYGISNAYTKSEIDKMLSTFSNNVESAYVSKNHLGETLLLYATTEYVDDELANNYYKKSQVDTLLNGYVTDDDLSNYVPSTGGTFNALAIDYNFGSIGNYKLYVNGRTYIAGSLRIGDATLSWDSTNKALKVDKPMYSTGTIASGGVAAAASQLTTLEARVKALEDKVGLTN